MALSSIPRTTHGSKKLKLKNNHLKKSKPPTSLCFSKTVSVGLVSERESVATTETENTQVEGEMSASSVTSGMLN